MYGAIGDPFPIELEPPIKYDGLSHWNGSGKGVKNSVPIDRKSEQRFGFEAVLSDFYKIDNLRYIIPCSE